MGFLNARKCVATGLFVLFFFAAISSPDPGSWFLESFRLHFPHGALRPVRRARRHRGHRERMEPLGSEKQVQGEHPSQAADDGLS